MVLYCEYGDVNMIYRLATEDDITMLSEMRWGHEYEERKINISKEVFIKECNSFLVNGLRSRTWVYWIAECYASSFLFVN